MNALQRKLLDRLKMPRDASGEATAGMDREDGTCGFTAKEIESAPRVVTAEPREDD